MFSLGIRFKQWLDASIGNRFAALLLALTFGFALTVGAGNFAYIYSLTRQTTEEHVREHVRDIVRDLGNTLREIEDDNRLLAGNPTVISAVLDARDQETYLTPLLANIRPRGRPPMSLCVTDYRGRSLGCAQATIKSYENHPPLHKALALGTPVAHIVTSGENQASLHLAYPVIYSGTGQTEGALVAEYDLVTLLANHIGSQNEYVRQAFPHIHLIANEATLFEIGDHDRHFHHNLALPIDGAFAPLDLRFGLGIDFLDYYGPLLRLTGAYFLLALLLTVLAFRFAHQIIPRLLHRLDALKNEANFIAATGKSRFDAETGGADEIGQLARAFATMTERLRAINASLEDKVETRTAELKEHQDLLTAIMDAVPGAIFQFRLRPDGSSCVPFVSQALQDIYDLRPEDVATDASAVFARVHPDDLAAHIASIHASAAQLSHWQEDFRVVHADGRICWLHGNALPRREMDGSVLWHGIITDITDYKRAEIALMESEAYSKALFTHSYIPLIVLDPDSGTFIDCNDAAVAIYRFSSRLEVLGKTPLDVSAPTQYDGTPSLEAGQCHIAAAREEGFHVFEWRHMRPNGEIWDAEVRLMSVRHGGQELMQFSLRDITEQKRSEAEIWRKANFDLLTGLANRGLCHDRLERAIARARRNGHKVGVLFIDLDGFKLINDTLGHAVGDELLIQVAGRLERCVRDQDTTCRLGGDEFVFVIPDIETQDDLVRIAAETVSVLNQPFTLAGSLQHISGSVGIAIYPDHASSGENLLERADHALYQAKRAGKNRYTFYAAV